MMDSMFEFSHKSVMLNEVLQYLQPKDGEVFMDCTFGAGGYTKAILTAANTKVIALDRDAEVKPRADLLKAEFNDKFTWHHLAFADMQQALNGELVDGIVFDLGVSSMQIDDGERGFSFMHDGPLDMRMDKTYGISAADIVNTYDEKEIADILYNYGDERKSYHIARMIIAKRAEKPFETTKELAEVIRRALGRRHDQKTDPATRSFQAIRIAVNDELRQIEEALKIATQSLKIGGRLVVVTFHSGEDIIVKKFFKEICGRVSNNNRHLPDSFENNNLKHNFTELHKGVITATNYEVESNIRSRSAKLRAVIKI